MAISSHLTGLDYDLQIRIGSRMSINGENIPTIILEANQRPIERNN